MIEKIDTGACTALVDSVAGAGLVVRLDREHDVHLPGLPTELPGGLVGTGSGSLIDESWSAMHVRLHAAGWVLDDNEEEGGPVRLATSTDGRTAYALSLKSDAESTSDEWYAEWEGYVRTLLERFEGDWVLVEPWMFA